MTEKAKALYNDYMQNWYFKSPHQKRAFKANVTKLAKKIDTGNQSHQPALMYLDALAMRLDMTIC